MAVCALIALTIWIAGPPRPAVVGAGPSAPPRPRPPSVLVFGDSVALTLGLALGDYTSATHDGIEVNTDAQLGCGIAEGTTVVTEGQSITLPPACNVDSPVAEQWPALLAGDIARYRPDVVVLLAGRWEAFDRPDGTGGLTDITQPGFAHDVELQLQRFVSIATASGARAVLMTAPYYQPVGGPSPPEDDPVRVDDYNRLVAAVVRVDPTRTARFPLGALVSPHGRFAATVDGQTVRAPDGLHFPFYSLVDPTAPAPDTYGQVLAFSRWIGPRVLPALLGAARSPPLRP